MKPMQPKAVSFGFRNMPAKMCRPAKMCGQRRCAASKDDPAAKVTMGQQSFRPKTSLTAERLHL